MQPGARQAKYDVEVLTAGDLWAQYGPTLLDNIETTHQQPSRWRRLGVCSAGALCSLTLHVLLFGRYMGQVKARIERAWEYPAAFTTVAKAQPYADAYIQFQSKDR